MTMTSPSEPEYTWRTVKVVVDDFPVITMYVWSDSNPAAIVDVCELSATMMRNQMERLATIRRYSNGEQTAKNEDPPGVEQK